MRPLYQALGLAFICLAPVKSALASEPPKPPPPAAPAKKADPPGLTGNKLPTCKEGEYVAGMICKIAPPGFYLAYGMKYPAPCPKGTTSPAGSKAETYCK